MSAPSRWSAIRIVACLGLAARFGAVPAAIGAQTAADCGSAVDAVVESGWTAYQEGRILDAAADFAGALASCPVHPGALNGSGYVELREGRSQVPEVPSASCSPRRPKMWMH